MVLMDYIHDMYVYIYIYYAQHAGFTLTHYEQGAEYILASAATVNNDTYMLTAVHLRL